MNNTLAERANTHGRCYLDQAQTACLLKGLMHTAPNWSRLMADQKEAMDMIAVKLARILHGDPNHADAWHDVAGYAVLVEDRLNGRPRT